MNDDLKIKEEVEKENKDKTSEPKKEGGEGSGETTLLLPYILSLGLLLNSNKNDQIESETMIGLAILSTIIFVSYHVFLYKKNNKNK